MKNTIARLSVIAGTAGLLCGCGESKPAASSNETKTPPAETPVAASAAVAPASATPAKTEAVPAVASPGDAIVPAAKAAASDLTAQFETVAKSQADSRLGALGGDLAAKVKSLASSAAGNDSLKSQLSGSMQSLATGNDAGGLASLYQAAKEASLTPQQQQLAKDVGNLASAYVVQKNFASLEGSQSDVATIVSSLRQGQFAPAVPALQKVAQNANLTDKQKELLSSLTQQYAPGISKAAGTLEQGLQSLQKLQGTGK